MGVAPPGGGGQGLISGKLSSTGFDLTCANHGCYYHEIGPWSRDQNARVLWVGEFPPGGGGAREGGSDFYSIEPGLALWTYLQMKSGWLLQPYTSTQGPSTPLDRSFMRWCMNPRRGASPVPAAIIMTGDRTFIGSRKLTTFVSKKPSGVSAVRHYHGILGRICTICHASCHSCSGPLLWSGQHRKGQKQPVGWGLGMLSSRLGRTPPFACAILLAHVGCPT